MINSTKKNVPVLFGNHTIAIDIGASNNILASLKARLLLKDLPDIYIKTTVFNKKNQVRDADTFINSIVNKILKIEEKYSKIIQESDEAKTLDLVIDLPGPYIKDKIYITNILDNSGKPIGEITPKLIPERLIGKKQKIGDFLTVNAAAGGCVLSKIEKQFPEILEEGREILYIYPGGGLGSGLILVDKLETKIMPLERQHVKAVNSEKSIEAEGGSATALLNNYLFFLSSKLPNPVLKKMNSLKRLSSTTVTNPRPPYALQKYESLHLMAAKYSMDKFIDCVAQLTAIEIAGGKTKSAVLTGRTAAGVIDGIKNNPLYIERNDALELIKEKIPSHLTTVGKHLMGSDFRVLFVPLQDSTEGSEILIKSYSVGNNSWVNIPKK